MKQFALAVSITAALGLSFAACNGGTEQKSPDPVGSMDKQQPPGPVSNADKPAGPTPVHSDTHGPQAPSAITFKSSPDPPKAGQNGFEVTVTDHEKQPITDAEVSVEFYMPASPSMNMPEMRHSLALKHASGGTYAGLGSLPMAGAWDARVSVRRAGTEIAGTTFKLNAQQ